jgi:hypothetical protein
VYPHPGTNKSSPYIADSEAFEGPLGGSFFVSYDPDSCTDQATVQSANYSAIDGPDVPDDWTQLHAVYEESFQLAFTHSNR